MRDSTEFSAGPRVRLYRIAVRDLWDNQTDKRAQVRVADAERNLSENDWRWIRGEWGVDN